MALYKELIGHVTIDSGQVVIVDPCHLLAKSQSRDYQEYCNTTPEKPEIGAALCFGTCDGDGHFPVYGYFETPNKFPYRICIDFKEDMPYE